MSSNIRVIWSHRLVILSPNEKKYLGTRVKDVQPRIFCDQDTFDHRVGQIDRVLRVRRAVEEIGLDSDPVKIEELPQLGVVSGGEREEGLRVPHVPDPFRPLPTVKLNFAANFLLQLPAFESEASSAAQKARLDVGRVATARVRLPRQWLRLPEDGHEETSVVVVVRKETEAAIEVEVTSEVFGRRPAA